MKRRLFIFLLFAFCGTLPVNAAQISLSYAGYDTDGAVIQGQVLSDKDENITVAVYKSDDGTLTADNAVYINQFTSVTDESGSFELELKTALSALDDGIYYVMAGGSNIDTAFKMQLIKKDSEIYFILGDVDGDSIISAADSAYILQYVLDMGGFPLTEQQLKAARVTTDDIITSTNAAMVLQKVLDSSYVFPVEREEAAGVD